jgi:hypothetical protein
VPEPFAAVFQPANVKPVLTKFPVLLANFVTAADETAVVEFGTDPPEFVFPS